MNYDFHSHFRLPVGECHDEVEDLLNGRQGFRGLTDFSSRLQLLSQAAATPSKTYAQSSDDKNRPSGLRKAINDHALDNDFEQVRKNWLTPLGLLSTEPLAQVLPPCSFTIQFDFQLRRPYISRDETDFYILENPVRKDSVFKIPYLAPTQWKGALRAAMMKQLVEWWTSLKDEERQPNEDRWIERRLQLVKLFGNEKGVGLDDTRFEVYLDEVAGEDLGREYRKRLTEITDTGLNAGRLHFYPTYFFQIGLEVINPHPRESGAGTQPIYFESVPIGATASFALFYAASDQTSQDQAESLRQVAHDLAAVAEGVRVMMTEAGFGAKTSSGFGVVHAKLPRAGSVFLWSRDQPYRFDALAPVARTKSLQTIARAAADDLLAEAGR